MINIKPVHISTWQEAQEWEKNWHDTCANSYDEETKQYVYAKRMGLDEFLFRDEAGRIFWNFGADKSVIDIGGGAYSLLLKSLAQKRTVVDPCNYPNWVRSRYAECGIEFIPLPAERLDLSKESKQVYDYALIYNCLQHTIDPKRIIENARKIAKEIRIFEWVETGTNIGHLHTLTEKDLNEWLGGQGKVEEINQSGAVGLCYYGIFPTL